jgi:hypothetical protein
MERHVIDKNYSDICRQIFGNLKKMRKDIVNARCGD